MTGELWADYSRARPDPTPYAGVMRYLQIMPTGTKGLEPAEVADLQARGKPIGLIWETGADAATEGEARAVDHAKRANAEADRLGAPRDVAIFYAVDFDTTAPEQWEPYVVALLAQPGRPVGVYGEADVTRRARELGVKWTWQTRAWSKGVVDPDAHLYQRDFLDGLDVSVEQHVFPAWGRPVPPPAAPPAAPEVPVTTKPKPPCVRVLWRGVIVCSHSVPKLNAWAKSVGQGIYLKPLPGCGSYQTSTVASAGTHAGGGAIDIDLRAVASGSRKWVADKGRTSGLQVSWHRNAISGLWTWHAHALDPDCPQLARQAAAQCVEMFNGGDGLVGTTPDGNTRTNVAQLKGIFNARAVVQVADAVTGIGGAVVAAAGFNYGDVKMSMTKGIDASALRPGQHNAHVARLQSAIWNWRGMAFRKNLVSTGQIKTRAALYDGIYGKVTVAMVGDSYKLLDKLEPRNGWLTQRQREGREPLPTWPGPKFLRRIGFTNVY